PAHPPDRKYAEYHAGIPESASASPHTPAFRPSSDRSSAAETGDDKARATFRRKASGSGKAPRRSCHSPQRAGAAVRSLVPPAPCPAGGVSPLPPPRQRQDEVVRKNKRAGRQPANARLKLPEPANSPVRVRQE